MDVEIRFQDEAKRITLPPGEGQLRFLLPRGVRLVSYPSFLLPDSSHPHAFLLLGDTSERIFQGTVTLARGKRKKTLTLLLECERREASFSDFQAIFPEARVFPEGGALLFAPGSHLLGSRLRCTPPFRITGAPGTVLMREGEVLRIEGEGEGFVRNVTFSLQGRESGNVVVVLESRVVFEDCVFRGGLREKLSWMGNGVVAARGANLVFRRCVFFRNEAAGILAEAETKVTVEDSLFLENGGEGILARQGAVLVVRRSRFLRNAWGVTCGAVCSFDGNEVAENVVGGVCLLEGAEGAFGGNRIVRNPVGVVWHRNQRILWGAGNILEGNRIPLLEEGSPASSEVPEEH